MIKILCPIDFSKHSKNALNYALHLAQILGAEMHILTAYSVPSTATSLISMNKIIEENRVMDLKNLLANVAASHVSIRDTKIHAKKGSPSAVINNYVKHNDIGLVVMGTKGGTNLENIIFGSVTRAVAHKTEVPLLAVPLEARIEELKSKPMLLALDSKEVHLKPQVIDLLKNLSKISNKELGIIHVMKDDQDIIVDPFILKDLEPYSGEIKFLESQNPIESINEYISENDISVLAMIHRQHSFFERLLLKDNTSQELEILTAPLLILIDHK